ncbi:hypothetical protein MMC28_003082 [Mycoblastus sanguinarius]|nr:hypothetical protein [Mycoblastus sanguinarius]
MKPLPPLPQRRLFPTPRVSASRGCQTDSRCILTRIKRSRSNDSPLSPGDGLLQRRNPIATPQLTLSVPQSNPRNPNPASAMVWLPDEQMWLISREMEQQNGYSSPPGPPAYTPRDYTHSEPSPNLQSRFDSLTPPMTPIQSQLQTPIEPRDEERMSPLFQEAMNSVPMVDPTDLLPPTSHEEARQDSRPQPSGGALPTRSTSLTSHDGLMRVLGSQSSAGAPPARSISLGSGGSHLRSESSDSGSYHSARSSITSKDLSEEANSAARWRALAERLARPASAMH